MVQNQKKDIDLETYRMYLNSYAKMQLQIRISVKLHYAENIHDLKIICFVPLMLFARYYICMQVIVVKVQ